MPLHSSFIELFYNIKKIVCCCSLCSYPSHIQILLYSKLVLLNLFTTSVVCWCFIPQAGTQPFNRAMLFNVGFKEAMKDLNWDCVVFHDVDHIPENDRNYYGCGQMPRHFATKLDKYMYM